MSSLRNWTQFHWPGEPLDNFTRSTPASEEEKATYVEGLTPRRKRRKLRVRPKDAFRAMTAARRKET